MIDVPAVILVKQSQVVIGIVKNDLDILVFQDLAESLRHADGEGVDDCASLARRDLQEVDSVDEAVEARSLGIDSNFPDSGNVSEKIVSTLLGIDVQKGL